MPGFYCDLNLYLYQSNRFSYRERNVHQIPDMPAIVVLHRLLSFISHDNSWARYYQLYILIKK